MKNILLTGATGVLGSHLLKLLLKENESRIFLLIRGSTETEAENRGEQLLSEITQGNSNKQEYIKKIRIIRGDITKENLGIREGDYEFLTNNINEVFHCAALTHFNAPSERLKEINVVGTNNILNLISDSKKIKILNYVSTAFICGNYEGVFNEKHFDEGQEFNNDYEKSKFEAELLVRKFQSNKIVKKIYRPSVILKESVHGSNTPGLLTQFFNFLSSGFQDILPINEKTLINIVPSGVAAEMIFDLSSYQGSNEIYHIANPKNFLFRNLVDLGCAHFGYTRPNMVDLNKFDFNKITQIEKALLNNFIPYINLRAILNSEMTVSCLPNKRNNYFSLDENFILKVLERTVRNKSF